MLAAVLFGCLAIALTIYLSYRFAERIERLLGETAHAISSRLSSFILLCIGVHILLERRKHPPEIRPNPQA